MLPGESLSKYGGAPVDDAPRFAQETAAPALSTSSTFKPSTLIEAPLQWDGSGLLPGESISKHRSRQTDSAQETEPQDAATAPDETEEEDLVTERTDFESESDGDMVGESTLRDSTLKTTFEQDLDKEDLFEETSETAPQPPDPEEYSVESVIEEPSADEAVAAPVVRQDENPDGPGSEAPTVLTQKNKRPKNPNPPRLEPMNRSRMRPLLTMSTPPRPAASSFSASARRRRKRSRFPRRLRPRFLPMPLAKATSRKKSSKKRSSTLPIITTIKQMSTISTISKRRPCPHRCALAIWASCSRKLISTIASS